MELPNRLSGAQKIFAFALLGAVGFGAVKLLNMVLPPINELIHNLWKLLIYGTPLALIILYVVSNPLVVWGFFKTLSWKFTSWLIKQDPLSVMDRYVDYLRKKLKGLETTIQVLVGKKIKLDRQVNELKNSMQKNLQDGSAAMKVGNTNAASMYGVKVQTNKNTLLMLTPLQTRIDKSLDFLQQLSENWKYGIEKLEYQIEGKRSEYEIIKETTKGLKTAEDFINSDNESARIYGQSLKALEESVTQKMGYIEEFTRNNKGIMDSIKIEKQANADEGLAELEKYMNNSKIQLPDFSNIGGIQDVDYEMVKQPSNGVSKFNLLKK